MADKYIMKYQCRNCDTIVTAAVPKGEEKGGYPFSTPVEKCPYCGCDEFDCVGKPKEREK